MLIVRLDLYIFVWIYIQKLENFKIFQTYLFVSQKIDNWSCSKANPVIVHSLDVKNSLLSRGSKNKFNIEIINNFSIPTQEPNGLISKLILIKVKMSEYYFCRKFGTFSVLDKIIDTMINLEGRKDIKLVIVGI